MKDVISEDDFDDWELVKAPDGDTVWNNRPHRRDHDEKHIWTIVEGDDGDLYAIPGYHIVNHVGYIVTVKPWPHENVEAVWHRFPQENEAQGGQHVPAL